MTPPDEAPAEAGPSPADEPAGPEDAASEDAAWAEVRAAWQDEARHKAYLARFSDLEGLAVAGRRYREALAAHPDDPVAARWRDEVLKRALVQGLASMPRPARPAGGGSRITVRALAFVLALVLGAAAWWVANELGGMLGARP